MFSNFGKVLLIFLSLMAAAVPAGADTLNGGALTPWNPNYLYSGNSYIPGVYYWNNASGDGNQANIGWCLIGLGQCGMQNPPGNLPFYSTAGAAPGDMFFTSGGNAITVTLQLALTDQKGVGHGTDLFGFYQTDATGQAILNPTVIFTSNDAIGNSYTSPPLTFSAGENYGFFVENVQGVGTPNETYYIYYMNSGANAATGSMGPDALQHFAVFSSGSTYYIAAVDADSCQGASQPGNSPCVPASEFDFNDFVVKVTDPPSSPEPASEALMAAGLLVMGLLVRRRAIH